MPKALRTIWAFLSQARRRHLVVLVFLMLFSSLLETLTVGSVIPFVSLLTGSADAERLFDEYPFLLVKNLGFDSLLEAVAALFLALVVFSGVARVLILNFQIRFGYSLGAELSAKIYENFLASKYESHALRNSNELVATITSRLNDVIHLVVLPMLTLTSNVLISFFIIVGLVWIEPAMAVAMGLFMTGAYLTIGMLSARVLRKRGGAVSVNQGRVMRYIRESYDGIRDIILGGKEAFILDAFRQADYRLRMDRAQINFFAAAPRYMVETLILAALGASAFVFLGDDGSGFYEAVPLIAAFALGAQKLLPNFQQVYANWALIKGGTKSLDTVRESLQSDEGLADARDQLSESKSGQIALTRAEYRYPGAQGYALRDVSMTIPPGARIGIVGRSGAGKSTLLDLIMGLIEPSSGVLTVGGETITRRNSPGWHRQIAHVPQNIFLIDGTLQDNITFLSPSSEINKDRVRFAAEVAELLELASSSAIGFEMPVGEGGGKLSGGQRQRIGIARAVYSKASVMILDEATSALDAVTEKRVISNLVAMEDAPTIILVTHNPEVLKICNVIYQLEGGRLKSRDATTGVNGRVADE